MTGPDTERIAALAEKALPGPGTMNSAVATPGLRALHAELDPQTVLALVADARLGARLRMAVDAAWTLMEADLADRRIDKDELYPAEKLAWAWPWASKTSIRDGSPTGRFVVDWEEAERAVEAALRAAPASADRGLREVAAALAEATERYLDTGRSPDSWATDRSKLWQGAKDVRAALAATDADS